MKKKKVKLKLHSFPNEFPCDNECFSCSIIFEHDQVLCGLSLLSFSDYSKRTDF